MREPLQLDEADIRAALRQYFGLEAAELVFLPLGDDTGSAAYRLDAAGGGRYFLKARRGGDFSAASLAVPRHLCDRGVPHVLAPLPTLAGRLWAPAGDYALSLSPFVEGRVGAAGGLSGAQWRALGTTTRHIHDDPLTPALRSLVRRESYAPSRRELLPALEAVAAAPIAVDPVQDELAAFWRRRGGLIRQVAARCDALSDEMRRGERPLSLCHGDLHTWNVLLDESGALWLVDWDEVTLAPRERDLMFVIEGIGPGLVSPADTAAFMGGYGPAEVDHRTLTYYRYAWAVQDIMAYGERAVLLPEFSVETRREALADLARLFEPGEIVDLALASDEADA
jgi:spectinomycin phosphotransferase